MRHLVLLGLGELQVLERGIIKRKDPRLPIHIETYGPTGRTLGNGEPEYVRFDRGLREKTVSPLESSSRKENVGNESSQGT